MTTTRVSAAAVAAVARRLTRAGIARSVEINRAFSSGFDVYMQGDHVQVTWTTWPWEEHPAVMRRAQLALCAHALSDHYTVTRNHDSRRRARWLGPAGRARNTIRKMGTMTDQLQSIRERYEALEALVRQIGERYGFNWDPDGSARSMLAKLGNEITLRRREVEQLKAVNPQGSGVYECPGCGEAVDIAEADAL